MAELTPTRSLAIALDEDRRTLREGFAFLDEKCLLLAGEMLREIGRWRALRRDALALRRSARAALLAAVGRHGLHGLQVYPPARDRRRLVVRTRQLLGTRLQEATLDGPAPPLPPAVNASPEAVACAAAYAALGAQTADLAAISGNLARLVAEYQRTVRRVRALQDVLLPEVERALSDVETALADLEQDEQAALRRAATLVAPGA